VDDLPGRLTGRRWRVVAVCHAHLMRRFVLFCNRSLFRGIVLALVAWNAAAADFLTGPLGGGKAEFSTASRAPLEYLPRVWETDEGLPYNRVQAIAQTLDGYLWVGTYQGLARFDGLQFTIFNNGSIPELNRASITALCTMADGAPMPVGAEQAGVGAHYLHFCSPVCAAWTETAGLNLISANSED
jgi:hypothetical protein